MPSAPWYPGTSRDTLAILYWNTHLLKQLLEIAQLKFQTLEVGVPTPFHTGLLDKETTTPAILVRDGQMYGFPGRFFLRVNCLNNFFRLIVWSSASIWHLLLKSWHPLGWPPWYLISWWGWLMVPWHHPCQWGPFWTPWRQDHFEVRCVDSSVVLSYHYYYFHYLVTQYFITLIVKECVYNHSTMSWQISSTVEHQEGF